MLAVKEYEDFLRRICKGVMAVIDDEIFLSVKPC